MSLLVVIARQIEAVCSTMLLLWTIPAQEAVGKAAEEATKEVEVVEQQVIPRSECQP
jgi:hypothetical protein